MSAETDDDWVVRQMADDDGHQVVAETQEPVDESGGDQEKAPRKHHRYDRKVATGLGGLALAAVVVVLVVAALLYSGGCQHSPDMPHRSVAEPAAVAVTKPVPPSSSAGAGTDRPLPYTADASKSCPAGSTSAQTMSGTDPHNAFVCVRGGLDGQVINIDLPKAFVITAISLTPGWVGKDASGVDQWSQHRVVTIAQYVFNHDPTTLVTQDTKNVHGDAVVSIKHQIAWTITMLIRQTSRPPADPQPTQTAGGGLGSVFGDAAPTVVPSARPADPLFGQPANNSDPVDATFAISRLKIVGHEAV